MATVGLRGLCSCIRPMRPSPRPWSRTSPNICPECGENKEKEGRGRNREEERREGKIGLGPLVLGTLPRLREIADSLGRGGGILELLPGPLDATYFSPEEDRRFSSLVNFTLPSKEEYKTIC